jgi:hypothetical protein
MTPFGPYINAIEPPWMYIKRDTTKRGHQQYVRLQKASGLGARKTYLNQRSRGGLKRSHIIFKR